MAVAQPRTNNGHQGQAPRRPQVHRVEVPQPPEELYATTEEPIGAVVRDAIDQTREIVKDTVAIGALEVKRYGLKAKRTVDEAKRTAEDVAPRVLWGVVASVMGAIAFVLLLIAGYIAAEVIIPSVAARLALVALPFVGIAAYGGYRAGKPSQPKTMPPRE